MLECSLRIVICTKFLYFLHFSSFSQVNKVGLKVRAALITEVYRKSLSISLATMSRYSTGQVCIFHFLYNIQTQTMYTVFVCVSGGKFHEH